MCLGFIYLNPSSSDDTYSLIIVNNRDEFYNRPTKELSVSEEKFYSGLDNEKGKEGGTWLGACTNGKIAMLLNVTGQAESGKKGRGELVTDYLRSEGDMDSFINNMLPSIHQYNPMTLVMLMRIKDSGAWKLSMLSNCGSGKICPNEACIGLSSSPYNEPFNKVAPGKRKFMAIVKEFNEIKKKDELIIELIKIMRDTTPHWPDKGLESRSKFKDLFFMQSLSSNFVQSSIYGTRTHSIILVDKKGWVNYVEITMVQDENLYREKMAALESKRLKEYIVNLNQSSLLSNPPSPSIPTSPTPPSSPISPLSPIPPSSPQPPSSPKIPTSPYIPSSPKTPLSSPPLPPLSSSPQPPSSPREPPSPSRISSSSSPLVFSLLPPPSFWAPTIMKFKMS